MAAFLLLTGFRERGNALEIADDAGQIIQILRAALGTGFEAALGNIAAGITDRVRNVEGEIGAAGADGIIHQVAILVLVQMLIQIDMTGAAAIQISGEFAAVQNELVEHIALGVFYDVEIGIVAIARDFISIAAIPCGEFDTEVFRQSVTFVTSLIYTPNNSLFLLRRYSIASSSEAKDPR